MKIESLASFKARKETFSVSRITEAVNGEKNLVETGLQVDLDVQNLSIEESATYDGNSSRAMKAYGGINVCLHPTDEIVGPCGTKYRVKSLQEFKTMKHKKFFLQRVK